MGSLTVGSPHIFQMVAFRSESHINIAQINMNIWFILIWALWTEFHLDCLMYLINYFGSTHVNAESHLHVETQWLPLEWYLRCSSSSEADVKQHRKNVNKKKLLQQKLLLCSTFSNWRGVFSARNSRKHWSGLMVCLMMKYKTTYNRKTISNNILTNNNII